MVQKGAGLIRRGRNRILSQLSPGALAEKDRQLAELRENWLKVHEAFRLSQELLARKDVELAGKDVELARKEAQLAEFRNNWIEAHEALQHRRNLLAQKDAQLAQLQAESNAVGEAFRLGQELLAQKEAELAKLQEQIAILEMKLR
jgi:ribosomal protein L3